MSRAWQRFREPVVVLLITVFVGLLSTSQRWAGLDTPDSSFYASLSLYGHEITDRAPIDSYYWTRLGYIAPVRLMHEAFGTWGGFLAWRMLLVLLLTGAIYVALRRFTGIASATFLTIIGSLSSVMLSYLGNTYLTGTVLAGTAVAMAAALFNGKRAAAVAGLALGWLVMVNPVGALLAGTVWFAVHLQKSLAPPPLRGAPEQAPATGAERLRTLAVAWVTAAVTAGIAFAALWLVGRLMFPGLDWLGTYLESNARITYSDFASKDAVWLTDISLIVPAAVLVTVAIAWVTHRREQAAQSALVISLTSIGFLFVFSPLMGGIPLEAPMYQAMLWPPAMLALALVTTMALPEGKWTALQVAFGVIAVIVVVACGHAHLEMQLVAGWLLAVAIVAVFLFAGYKRTAGAILGLAVLLGGAQLIQNARGDLGLYYLSPYNWAFDANPISDRIHTAVNVQEWLLSRTTNADTVLGWVDGDWVGGDRELYVVAAMQLWGENRVTLEPTLTDPDGLARLAQYRPSVIAMYGQSMSAVNAFWASLPARHHATPPECYDFDWAPNPASRFTVTHGLACLTHLTWS